MAMINVNYDTKAKTCTVTMDGVAITDFSNLSVYNWQYEDRAGELKSEAHIELVTEERLKDDDAHKVTKIYASRIEEQEDDSERVSVDELEACVKSNTGTSADKLAEWLVNRQEF